VSLGLGIDAGGTATRWALADAEGRPQGTGVAAPLSGHIFSRAAEARAREIIGEIARAVGPARPEGVVAGVTGLTREAPAVALIRSMLSGALKLPEERVHVTEDMWIAYLAHFAPGEGILVYGGTGSIGYYYLGEDKETIRVGGRGNLIDDGGSAFWIARHALRHVLRAEEEAPGSGWTTPLGTALARALGGTGWNEVRAFVYGGDRGRIGLLARAVAEAADADGAALAILGAAGRELARLGLTLLRRVGARPVALTGRAARMHPAILAAFEREVAPLAPVIAAEVDPALAAARLAASLP
jgi:N-acetylglucosamine kinase-like BadF-type ATPase